MMVVGNTIYTGTHNDGIYSSSDIGNTWTKIGTGNPLDTLSNSIIFSMLNPAPNILLAGACGFGLYRSTDNGATWTHIIAGLPNQSGSGWTCINSLALSGTKVVAATTEGIYYSSNNGLTWSASNITGDQVYASGLAVHDNIVCTGIVSFTIGSGVYRSVNNGVTWVFITNVIQDVISMASGEDNHFYAGTFNDNWVSGDNGLTWSTVGPGIPNDIGGFVIMTVDNYVFIGNNLGIFYSEDYGDSFSDANLGMDPYPNNAVQGLAFDGNYVYAGLFLNAIWRRPVSDFGIIGSCPTMVSNLHDSGPGSLREIISCSLAGTTITFDPALMDQTLILTTGEIAINNDLTLSGLGITHFTVSGNNASRIFHVFPGKSLTLKNMSLKNATAITNGGALFVEGNLSLENMLLQNNFENGVHKGMTIISSGTIQFANNVQINN
jgi:hypothetical protein